MILYLFRVAILYRSSLPPAIHWAQISFFALEWKMKFRLRLSIFVKTRSFNGQQHTRCVVYGVYSSILCSFTWFSFSLKGFKLWSGWKLSIWSGSTVSDQHIENSAGFGVKTNGNLLTTHNRTIAGDLSPQSRQNWFPIDTDVTWFQSNGNSLSSLMKQ